ncbi:MAG: dihydrolipoyllysine-residue acetyltransferase [Chromatiales bacterium]|nr:dihydrolipoyllysine-residue acetyltransferase [Chromatiales bacterium]
MSKSVTVEVPDIGDFKNVEIIDVLVKAGDTVKPEDPLITLESDKATIDVPAPAAGVVKALKVKKGDRVSQGSVILDLDAAEAAARTPAPEAAPRNEPAAAAAPTPIPAAPRPPPTAALPPVESGGGKAHASPSIRRFARELGVDLTRVDGSGPKGRILRDDVQNYVKRALSQGGGLGVAPMPEIDFSQFGTVETQPLSRINRLSAQNLHRNWVTIPHVTQFDEADITELDAFRKSLVAEYDKKGVKITFLAFLMKAVVSALKEFPRVNASLDATGENLVLKKYYHLGVAVDTPDGLVVPVIRDVDRKTLVDLARELQEVSDRARNKKLKAEEMQGSCFTISSLGGIGGTAFTPIVNAPDVAILGVSKASMKPVWNGKEFQPRLVLPLSLSYDHRVIDGVLGARFTAFLAAVLSDMRRLLL